MVAAFAALFLLLQGASLAHAAQYGSEHSHDGVVCEAVPLAEEAEALAPPPARHTLPEPAPAPLLAPVPYAEPALANAPARAPPSRGPPTHSR